MDENTKLLEAFRTIIFESCKKGLMRKRDKFSLTFMHRSIIGFLAVNKRIRMVDLSEMICVSKPALTRIIDTLEKKQVVKRVQMSGDRRSFSVEMTPKGEQYVSVINRPSMEVLTRLMARCTAAEREAISKGAYVFVDKLRGL